MQVLHANRALAGADSGAARDGAGAFTGSASRGAAGIAARRVDARNAISSERRKPIWRSGCGGGAGARNLVVAAAGVDFEDSRNDGNFAQRISLGCCEQELRGRGMPNTPSIEATVELPLALRDGIAYRDVAARTESALSFGRFSVGGDDHGASRLYA